MSTSREPLSRAGQALPVLRMEGPTPASAGLSSLRGLKRNSQTVDACQYQKALKWGYPIFIGMAAELQMTAAQLADRDNDTDPSVSPDAPDESVVAIDRYCRRARASRHRTARTARAVTGHGSLQLTAACS